MENHPLGQECEKTEKVIVNGQQMTAYYIHGLVHIKHPEFSLVGTGITTEDARHDVGACCGLLLDEFPELIPDHLLDWVQATAINNKDSNGRCRCWQCRQSRTEGID